MPRSLSGQEVIGTFKLVQRCPRVIAPRRPLRRAAESRGRTVEGEAPPVHRPQPKSPLPNAPGLPIFSPVTRPWSIPARKPSPAPLVLRMATLTPLARNSPSPVERIAPLRPRVIHQVRVPNRSEAFAMATATPRIDLLASGYPREANSFWFSFTTPGCPARAPSRA